MILEQLGKTLSTPVKLEQSLAEDKQASESTGFLEYLKGALGEVDQLQKVASVSADNLAAGEGYLHNTFIAYEKANLALQLTVEVRNRIVEAYQEIMRMQV
jgi:flagellar hook-basal body complex protein FliE